MGLLAWYPLSKDYLNNGLDGVDLSVAAGGIGLDGMSNFGGGLNCTGNAAKYVHRPGFKLEKDFTWCCWVRIAEKGTNTFQFIMSEGRDNTPNGMNILYYPSQNVFYLILESLQSSISTAVTLGKWYHIAVTVEEKGVNAYIDGKLSKTLTYVKPTYTQSNDRFVIGKMAYGYTSLSTYFPVYGVINDVRVYDNVLSVKEISEIAKGLCLHFPMNQMDKPMCNLVDVDDKKHGVNANAASVTTSSYYDTDTGRLVYRQKQTIKDTSVGNWHYCTFGIYRDYFKKNTKYYYQAWVRCNMDLTITNISVRASNGLNAAIEWSNQNIKAYTWTKISGIATSNTVEINSTNAQVFYMTVGPTADGLVFEITQPLIVESDIALNIGFCPDHGSNLWYLPAGVIEYDTSGFKNHGSSIEATTPYCAYGEMGPCYDFKSEVRYIKAINPLKYSFPFSIAFWMYYDTSLVTQGTPCILAARTAVGNGLACFVTDASVRFDDNVANTYNTGGKHPNKWTHVVLVHDTATKYIYVNGVSIGSGAAGSMENFADNLFIGISSNNASTASTTNCFRGKICDLRFYNTALSTVDVNTMYKSRHYVTDHSVLITGEIIS